MFRRILTALTAFVLAGLTLAVPSPAQAAASDCSNYPGTFCLFMHTNYGTPIWRQFPYQVTGCVPLTNFNDVTTLAWNNTGGSHLLRMWINYPCGGSGNQYYDLPSGTVVDFSTSWNDKISAIEDIEF